MIQQQISTPGSTRLQEIIDGASAVPGEFTPDMVQNIAGLTCIPSGLSLEQRAAFQTDLNNGAALADISSQARRVLFMQTCPDNPPSHRPTGEQVGHALDEYRRVTALRQRTAPSMTAT